MAVHTEQSWAPRTRKQVTHRSPGANLPDEFDAEETLRRLGKRALGHLSQYAHHGLVCAELRLALNSGIGLTGALRAGVTAMGQYSAAREICEDVASVLRRVG